MNLLQTIVTGVSRKLIPADSNWFAQDLNGVVFGYEKKPTFFGYNYDSNEGMLRNLVTCEVSEDAATTVIRYKDLMRAYDLVEKGYTLWFGGDCPVDKNLTVSHVMDNSYVGVGTIARMLDWDGGHIIAYKVVAPSKPHAVSLACLFVENVPREDIPNGYSEFRVGVMVNICAPESKIIRGFSDKPLTIANLGNLSKVADLAEIGDSVTAAELMNAYDIPLLAREIAKVIDPSQIPQWANYAVQQPASGCISFCQKKMVKNKKMWLNTEPNQIYTHDAVLPIINTSVIVSISQLRSAYELYSDKELIGCSPKHFNFPCSVGLDVGSVTITGQHIEREGDKIFFTPDEVVQVSKKIQVGDILETESGLTFNVLFIGKNSVFLLDLSNGEEFSTSYLDVLEFYNY